MTPIESIGHLADIPVNIDVELARKAMTVGQILGLQKGSVIKMMRSAGDNIDILVGGALLGSGEIVIIEETVGVRITDFNEED
ncbi:MAG TPA: FliM/FliN family flagellar motor switch protein [Bryobacteraceae bacterium]|jgi:flagellar motor switch protein FliN/FliY